jgi:WD40 repeat protein
MYLHDLGQIGEPKAFAHPDTVRKAVWSEGNVVFTGGQDGAVRTWDVRTGKESRYRGDEYSIVEGMSMV